jgi:pyroglutamyl-peptidase
VPNWPPCAASFILAADRVLERTSLLAMNKPKRILLYGFGPYRQFRDNITARIIKSFSRQAGLRKIVFPARFHRKQFIDAIERNQPDLILGLGQSSRRRIDVESQATNRRCAGIPVLSKRISPRGPARIKTTLKLTVGRQAGRSSNAGDYVCNFSMYVMLDYIRRNGLEVSYGFVHIPHDYDEKKAARLIEEILADCQRASLGSQG